MAAIEMARTLKLQSVCGVFGSGVGKGAHLFSRLFVLAA